MLAGAERRSREIFLAQRWIRGESFVYRLRRGRSKAARTRESRDDAVPDLVRCPGGGPHEAGTDVRLGLMRDTPFCQGSAERFAFDGFSFSRSLSAA